MAKAGKYAENNKSKGNKIPRVKAAGAVRNKKGNGAIMNDNKVSESDIQYASVKHSKHLRSAAKSYISEAAYTAPVSEKIIIIKNGISKKELEAIKKESNLDYETLSNILSVSKAKLHSKKGTEKFDQNTSERIMLLADVVAYGQSVFEDKDSFNEWLKANNKALGNKPPIELMDTIYGIDEVKKEIGRIEYGVF